MVAGGRWSGAQKQAR
jgi:hypothetical protein